MADLNGLRIADKKHIGLARDAQGRGHHGRHQRRAGEDREDAGAVSVMALERVPSDIVGTAAWRGCRP